GAGGGAVPHLAPGPRPAAGLAGLRVRRREVEGPAGRDAAVRPAGREEPGHGAARPGPGAARRRGGRRGTRACRGPAPGGPPGGAPGRLATDRREDAEGLAPPLAEVRRRAELKRLGGDAPSEPGA